MMDTINGISYIPNNPYKLWILKYLKHTIKQAEANWPNNFLDGDRILLSSLIPVYTIIIKEIDIKALIIIEFMYPNLQEWNTFSIISGVIKTPIRNIKKNANPPKEGTIFLWELLSFVEWISLFLIETALIKGIINQVSKKLKLKIDM